MNAVRTLVLGFVLLVGLGWVTVSVAQQPVLPPARVPPVAAPGQPVYYGAAPGTVLAIRQDSSLQAVQLAQQYVKATKEEDKRETRKKLTEVLNQQFEQRLQQQQKELDDLEKQIASLKEVLRKRTAAKATIVERRIEQLVQEAEGLGWNNPSSPHTRNPFGVGYGWAGETGSFGRTGRTDSTPAPKAPAP